MSLGAAAGASRARAPDASSLRATCDALAVALRARAAGPAPSDDERAVLKGEIVALIRAAGEAARAATALDAEARGLAALWKALPREPESPGDAGGLTAAPAVGDRSTDACAHAISASADGDGGGAPRPVPNVSVEPRPNAPSDRAPEALSGLGSNAPDGPTRAGAPRRPRRTSRADHLGASTYAARGWTAYAAGDYAASEAAYAQAAALAPDDSEAAALHGWALAALGRDDDALLAAHRVLTTAPPPPAGAAALARVALGRVCLHKGITGEALEHLARVTRDDADRRATLYATFHLGVAYGRRGMHDSAVTFLRRALALGPNLVEAYYELGRAHWQAGAPEAAHEAWRAGAGAGKFSPWAARCEELRLHLAGGGALPAA